MREKVFRGIKGHRYTKWENGATKESWDVDLNYKKDGVWRRFDDRGNLMERREYKGGRLLSQVTEEWRAVEVNEDHEGMPAWLESQDGKVWHIDGYTTDYSMRVDMDVRRYCNLGGEGLPTVQDLMERGTLTERTCYEEVRMRCGLEGSSGPDVEKVIAFFRERGYNVTEEAVEHNLAAWAMDMKSGYRDEANGYHLFTPCGCNPLSFTLTSLNELCRNWQKTYIA